MLLGMKRLVVGVGKPLATAAIQQVEEWTGARLLKSRTQSMDLGSGVLQSMVATVNASIGSGVSSHTAVEGAIEAWQRVAVAVAVEAEKRNIGEVDQSRFQFLPKLLVRSHVPDADLDKLVVEMVGAWEAQENSTKQQQKREQSVWDSTHNVTKAERIAVPTHEIQQQDVEELQRFVAETFGKDCWKPTSYEGGLEIK